MVERSPSRAPYLQQGEHALQLDGSLRDARRWFTLAYDEALPAGRVEDLAEAAVGLGGLWLHERRTAAEAADVEARQRHALSLLRPASIHALRLRTRLAAEADYRKGGFETVLAAVDEARRTGDPVALSEALSLAHHCMLGPDHTATRLELASEMLRAATTGGRRSDVLMGLAWRTADLFLSADPHAERSVAELRGALADRGHLATQFIAAAFDVMLNLRHGRFDEAEIAAQACATVGESAGDADATGWYGAQLVAIRWYQGRTDELIPLLDQLVHSPTLSAADNAFFAALAASAAIAGDRRTAACALERLRSRGLDRVVRSGSWLVAMYGAVEAAYFLGDQSTAAEAYALLTPFAHLPMMASLGIACFGSTQQALGVAALTLGNLDAAVEHFRSAVRANQALGHLPAAVFSRYRLGLALTQRGAGEDAAEGARERAVAADDAEALGMRLPPAPAASPPPTDVRLVESTTAIPLCRRRGQRWEVQLGRRTAVVADSIGMKHVAALLAHPGKEIAAIDLAGGLEGRRALRGQPVLDERALRDYRKRFSELDAEIDEYEALHDPERAARARAERDWLLAELEAATGLRGRIRDFADDAERARIAVSKAIRRAVDRVATADPVIGNELRERLKTGLRCCFVTD